MNCPIKTGTIIYITDEGDQIELYECPFGEHAWHLWDHRCTKLTKRKEVVESLENKNAITITQQVEINQNGGK